MLFLLISDHYQIFQYLLLLYVIVATDPGKFSVFGFQITLNEIKKNISERYDIDVNITILLNKFDTSTNLSDQVLIALLSNDSFNRKVFKSFVRTSQKFPNSISKGLSIFDLLKTSTTEEDIDLLCHEIIDLCKNHY